MIDQKPLVNLPTLREVNRPELPAELIEFYSRHEGVGFGSSPNRVVRIALLEELKLVGWKDVSVSQVPEGWEHFAAWWVAYGTFGEKIVYVLEAPCCPSASILGIEGILACGGPAGVGPHALGSSLVLAKTFRDWLVHLAVGVEEPIIAGPGGLPLPQHREPAGTPRPSIRISSGRSVMPEACLSADITPPPSSSSPPTTLKLTRTCHAGCRSADDAESQLTGLISWMPSMVLGAPMSSVSSVVIPAAWQAARIRLSQWLKLNRSARFRARSNTAGVGIARGNTWRKACTCWPNSAGVNFP